MNITREEVRNFFKENYRKEFSITTNEKGDKVYGTIRNKETNVACHYSIHNSDLPTYDSIAVTIRRSDPMFTSTLEGLAHMAMSLTERSDA